MPSTADDTPTAGFRGKADGWSSDRGVEVVLTEPHCDVCTEADKAVLLEESRILGRVVEIIDGAQRSVDAAQFTFSRDVIADALMRARDRGVAVRLALDAGQDKPDSLGSRLRDSGLDVRFVKGRDSGAGYAGLLHAKFLIADGTTLATGSNNWSSTGVSINEENMVVVRAAADDPLLAGFACHFEKIWAADVDGAGSCSNDHAAFTPGSGAIRLLKDAIRAATVRIDVLMHHFTFDDLVEELAKAQERGVQVRVIVNAADREEHTGSDWSRLFAAGGRIRFKQSNESLFQFLHHKLAIVDGRILLNGSGNWSGSGFFNNYENYVRYDDPRVVSPFRELFERLWVWSLTGESLEAGRTAAEQHTELTPVFFGNLHAHFVAEDSSGQLLDDGKPARKDEAGAEVPVDVPDDIAGSARFAYEYGRDRGALDFLVLSPHTRDPDPDDDEDIPTMQPEGYAQLLEVAAAVTSESAGTFLAVGGMEWNTTSAGNHVNIFGSRALAQTRRGEFDVLYGQLLRDRAWEGDIPLVMLNHPRTFRNYEESLNGSWDQVFDTMLTDIPREGERRAKFNDYGLDDYSPLREVRDEWIEGRTMPDRQVIAETMARMRDATASTVRLMEVTVGRGSDIGHEGGQNPSLNETETGEVERYTHVHDDFDHYLLSGFRIAPTASHDNHYANWGTGHSSRTAIFAETLTEEALLTAIDVRAVYASEDQNLEARFFVDNRVLMGQRTATVAASVPAQVFVADPDYDGRFVVRIYGGRVGGETVEMIAEAERTGRGWVTLDLSTGEAGEHFFYVEVWEPEPNRMAWTAPIWVRKL